MKARRFVRFRLLAAAVVAGTALAVSGWRLTHRARNAAPLPPQPILGDDVVLPAPPPLPGDDRLILQAGLRQERTLQATGGAQQRDPAIHMRAAQAATQAGDLLTARAEINAARALNSVPAPPVIMDVLARCEAQLGLFAQAQRTYLDLIARAPADAIGYVGLSRIQYRLGQRQESSQTLERGILAVPLSDSRGRVDLVSELEARAEIKRALAEAQAASNAAPHEPAANIAVARLLGKLGRLTAARALLEQLLAAQPDSAEALAAYADLRLNPLLPNNDLASLEQTLLVAGQHNPRDPSSYLRLGRYYQEQGRYRQAAYVYTRLLALIPDSAAGRLQLAYAEARLGNGPAAAAQQRIAQHLLARDKAEALLITRRDAHPADVGTRLALAHHYIGAGQFSKALIEMQAATCLAPGSQPIRRELAAFYRRIGAPPATPPAGNPGN